MISSLRTYFKELNRKMVDVAENVKRLGCNVCQLENRVRDEFMLNLLLIKQPIRTEKIWFMILPLFFFCLSVLLWVPLGDPCIQLIST